MSSAPFHIYTSKNIYNLRRRKKICLYVDCDGVILDTIESAKRIAKRLGYDPDDYDSLHEYFLRDVNWKQIIEEGGTIGDAVESINSLANSGRYEVVILTKISKYSLDDILYNPTPIEDFDKDEISELYKLYFLKKILPNIPIIFLDASHSKENIVNPKDSILIEDELRNFRKWRKNEEGERVGVGVLFSREGRKNYCYNYKEDKYNNPITDEEAECMISSINDIEDLPEVQELLRDHHLIPNTRIHKKVRIGKTYY